jgi:hypothetical protein
VQYMIEIDIARKREGDPLGHATEDYRGSSDLVRWIRSEPLDELRRFLANCQTNLVHRLLAFTPGQHEERDDKGDG